MKTKVIAMLLALTGVCSCSYRPHKSKKVDADEPMLKTDSIEPIRLMYGVPYRTFEIRPAAPPADSVK